MCLDELFFKFVGHFEECDGISDHILLNFEVEGRVSGEAGRCVYFYQPRLQFLIDEDVEAQDLEAQGVYPAFVFGL